MKWQASVRPLEFHFHEIPAHPGDDTAPAIDFDCATTACWYPEFRADGGQVIELLDTHYWSSDCGAGCLFEF
ncbi:hypothetical protein [Variovorax gossypii]